jgi:hypothetical protein
MLVAKSHQGRLDVGEAKSHQMKANG